MLVWSLFRLLKNCFVIPLLPIKRVLIHFSNSSLTFRYRPCSSSPLRPPCLPPPELQCSQARLASQFIGNAETANCCNTIIGTIKTLRDSFKTTRIGTKNRVPFGKTFHCSLRRAQIVWWASFAAWLFDFILGQRFGPKGRFPIAPSVAPILNGHF